MIGALSLAKVLVWVAVALLPQADKFRFEQEWVSEVDAVRRESGRLAAIHFAARLLIAAPKMTLAMRADSESAFAELSIALVFSIFPSSVLTVLAIYTQVWIMVVGELFIIVGIVLMVSGFWSVEGRLFDSTRSRIGIVLAAVGSVIEVVVRRNTGFGPPIDEVVSADIPHAMIMIGLLLWALSSYVGGFRFRVLFIGILLVAPGAALNSVVIIVNATALSGFDRFGVLMYLLPSTALAWASYLVVGRKKVFHGNAPKESPQHVAL